MAGALRNGELDESLRRIDRRIDNLNRELETIDVMLEDTNDVATAELKNQVSTLHRYIQLNGRRDNLNMERLQIVAARQNLSEISETPFNESVGRLPLRIISIGIPLLLLFQLYQWVILNQGLQEVINNPNITLAEFIRILLDNIEF